MAQPQNTTKNFVEIADIRDGLVILKNGSLRSIIEATSVNFELKSNDEQIALISGFQNFLNALDFPLQIIINSRKLDITGYLKSLDTVITSQKNELLRIQATEYSRFVKGLTELANIMAKHFYISVPYYVAEVPTNKAGFLDALKGALSPGSRTVSLPPDKLETYKTQLEQRLGVVMGGLNTLGLETRLLTGQELSNLYYSYYNPGQHLT